MFLNVLRFVFFALTLSPPAIAEIPTVESVKSFPARLERMALQSVVMGDKVLLAGGYGYEERVCHTDLALVDESGQEVKLPFRLTDDRNHFQLIPLSEKRALAIAGFSEGRGSLMTVEEIDLENGTVNKWKPLGSAIELFTATLLPGDRVAVIGGLTAKYGVQTNLAIYWINTQNKRVSRNIYDLAQSRFGHQAVFLPKLSKVLVIGGKNVKEGSKPALYSELSSLEFIDVESGEVTPAGEMTATRDRPQAHLMEDGKVLIFGGMGAPVGSGLAPKNLTSIELYDPETKTSQVVGDMGVPRMAHQFLPFQGGLIVTGGWVDNPDLGKKIEFIDLRSFKASFIGDLASSRAEHRMHFLTEKKFILVGGKDNFGANDPHSHSFKSTEIVTLK